MLPENLKENATATALEAFDGTAVVSGKFDRDELTIEIAPEKIVSVCGFLKYDLRFVRLSTVTGVDWYPLAPRFQLSYHILSHAFKERIRLRVMLDEAEPSVDSITPVWPGANFYEREVFDLFGIHFADHPDLRRIMLPDDWQGHPLRKDYPVEGYR